MAAERIGWGWGGGGGNALHSWLCFESSVAAGKDSGSSEMMRGNATTRYRDRPLKKRNVMVTGTLAAIQMVSTQWLPW